MWPSTRVKKRIEHYETAERVFHASLTDLEATGMRAVSAQSIATGKSLDLAQEECVKAVEARAQIISLSEPEYPFRLKEIYDPPRILFIKGSVGSGTAWHRDGRNASSYTLRQRDGRTTLDRSVARGLVIISGLARGIDTLSHRGAVAAKGKTVAVLGTGIDVMYPKENTRLTEQIVALGGRADHRVSGGNSAKNLWGPKHSDQAGSEARRHLGRASDGDSGHAQFEAR